MRRSRNVCLDVTDLRDAENLTSPRRVKRA
jgi:hypothetical protein